MTEAGETGGAAEEPTLPGGTAPVIPGTALIVTFSTTIGSKLLPADTEVGAHALACGHPISAAADTDSWEGVGTLCRVSATADGETTIVGQERVRARTTARDGTLWARWWPAPVRVPAGLVEQLTRARTLYVEEWADPLDPWVAKRTGAIVRWTPEDPPVGCVDELLASVTSYLGDAQRREARTRAIDEDDLGLRLEGINALMRANLSLPLLALQPVSVGFIATVSGGQLSALPAVGELVVATGHAVSIEGPESSWEGVGTLCRVVERRQADAAVKGLQRVTVVGSRTATGGLQGRWRTAPTAVAPGLADRVEAIRRLFLEWSDPGNSWAQQHTAAIEAWRPGQDPRNAISRMIVVATSGLGDTARARTAALDAGDEATRLDLLESWLRELRVVPCVGRRAVIPDFWAELDRPQELAAMRSKPRLAIATGRDLAGVREGGEWSGPATLCEVEFEGEKIHLKGLRPVLARARADRAGRLVAGWDEVDEFVPPDVEDRFAEILRRFLRYSDPADSWLAQQIEKLRLWAPGTETRPYINRLSLVVSRERPIVFDARAELVEALDVGRRLEIIGSWVEQLLELPCIGGNFVAPEWRTAITRPHDVALLASWQRQIICTGHEIAVGEDAGRWTGIGVVCRVLTKDSQVIEVQGVQRVRVVAARRSGQIMGRWTEAPESTPADIGEQLRDAQAHFARWADLRDPSAERHHRALVREIEAEEWSGAVNRLLMASGRSSEFAAALDIDDLGDRLALIRSFMTVDSGPARPHAALLARIGELPVSPEVRARLDRELDTLRRSSPGEPEAERIVGYLDVVAALPWNSSVRPPIHSLEDARGVLDGTHAGMGDLKRTILDQLAALLWWGRRCAAAGGPLPPPPLRNILVVGPPGTGKTTVLRSIARALCRSLHVIACGGISDIAALNGFERSYVGARPGAIIEAVRQAGTVDLVLGLDEIDKMVGQNRGDPFAVLMELTDPSQNGRFTDRYLQIPFDLSKVLVIATANEPWRIPAALLDRFLIIELRGYSPLEKLAMAHSHFIPRLREDLGVDAGVIELDGEALTAIINEYTYESGVRGLIDRLMTAHQRVIAELLDDPSPRRIDAGGVHRLLGRPTTPAERPPLTGPPGCGTVLSVSSASGAGAVGGQQVRFTPGGKGALTVTGSVNDEVREGVEVAYSYVRGHAGELGLDLSRLAGDGVHLHQDRIGTSKGGPSGGLAALVGMVSLFRGVPLPDATGMTGEITLDGRVLTVGGIPEKLVAAHRAGVERVLIPALNREDLADVPADVLTVLEVVPVADVAEALEALWPRSGGR